MDVKVDVEVDVDVDVDIKVDLHEYVGVDMAGAVVYVEIWMQKRVEMEM